MVSVCILTLNEQRDLPGCLAAAAWSDDVVVFDSGSTDGTAAIARAAGARLFVRPFDNYADQRNAALNDVPYRHEWVLMADADERWPVAIFDEIRSVLARPESRGLCIGHFRRIDVVAGRRLRRSTGYPTWTGRLLRRGRVRIERRINEQYRTDGGKAFFRSHFVHYPLSKGVEHWIARHNRYSSMEAEAIAQRVDAGVPWRGLLSRDPTRRRRALKRLAYRMPCRPLLAFAYLYVLRLGLLDGRPGLMYCRMRAMYERMIDLKLREIRTERGRAAANQERSKAAYAAQGDRQ